ncbi:hypothetical protein, variant [Phytophthora nicotianae CJ01A1]|uniref:Uncharacterized protein n=4 Tax=Phytophthora nicotianae TaxID=4792 RepID=V9FNY7_PHYNI|nr:hypothetical protein, variant [Phytophthora nicotianae P1569]ETL98571.1 hypothetical protein, variant [Phytophthora nicotianae]ETP21933.1 hypothetical protein, variant [Phytophthora nicotianae CJ01A1]ETP49836.1 hypothetical protein, variant [Phytophthora nicotianae P10297]
MSSFSALLSLLGGRERRRNAVRARRHGSASVETGFYCVCTRGCKRLPVLVSKPFNRTHGLPRATEGRSSCASGSYGQPNFDSGRLRIICSSRHGRFRIPDRS